jgi:hypothetical protein
MSEAIPTTIPILAASPPKAAAMERHTTRRDIAAGGLALLGLVTAPAASRATAISAVPIDPVVTLWAKTQAVNAELERIDDQHQAMHDMISRRRPGQPKGVTWVDWHRGDPDMDRSEALYHRSNELCEILSGLHDQIAAAVAVTPEGVRAKAAAALSVWVDEKALQKEYAPYDLIANALREAAAGSAG